MVQEFQVLRCCSCETFQVHQVKKAKKWACKLCSQKQSYMKIFGQGSGPDCRRHVQKLNMCRGEALDSSFQPATQQQPVPESSPEVQVNALTGPVSRQGDSRWVQYLDREDGRSSNDEDPTAGENFTTDRQEFDRHHKERYKHRPNRMREQRVAKKSGTLYRRPEHCVRSESITTSRLTVPSAHGSGSHYKTPPSPTHCVSLESEKLTERQQTILQEAAPNCERVTHPTTTRSNTHFPSSTPAVDTEGRHSSSMYHVTKIAAPSKNLVNEQLNRMSSKGGTPGPSKWSLFLDSATDGRMDSEDEDENQVGLECATTFTGGWSERAGQFHMSTELHTSSEKCGAKKTMFSTDDNLDEIIGEF